MDNPRYIAIRALKALARCKGSPPSAHAFAVNEYGINSPVTRLLYLKTLDTGDIFTAEPFRIASDGVVALVKSRSPIARIGDASPWRPAAPFVRTLKQTAGAVAAFVGEAQSITVTDAALEEVRLAIYKIAGIELVTDELMKLVGDAGDAILGADLARALALTEGRALLDPSEKGTPDVQPPSLTADCITITSSGTDAASIMYDLQRLFDGYQGDLNRAVLVASQATILPLAMLGVSIGAQALSAGAQTWLTLPLVYVEGMAMGDIALVDPSSVLMVPPMFDLTTSSQATVQVIDGTSGESSFMSMWQANLHGVKSVEYVSWEVAREDSVRLLTGMKFPAPTPPATASVKSITNGK
jgi:Phage capsid family